MSIIRTALSLIGFGFTIFQFFRSLKGVEGIKIDPSEVVSHVGLWLVGMGIFLLTLGIIYHILFMQQVRRERQQLDQENLLIKNDNFPYSMTLFTAILLLLLGIFVIFKMVIAAYG
jgi:putative membrane protein